MTRMSVGVTHAAAYKASVYGNTKYTTHVLVLPAAEHFMSLRF